MKKFLIAAAALALVSGSALADRNYDLRDSDTYTGKFATNLNIGATSAQALVIIAPSNDEMSMEQRRLDEKNDVNG